MLQCSRLTTHLKLSSLQAIRTSTSFYSQNQNDPKNRPPQRRSILEKINKRSSKMVLEDLPNKESLESILKVQKANLDSIPDEFKTVYKFPQIRYFGLINRLKIYQSFISGLMAFGSMGLCGVGVVSGDTAFTNVVIGISACCLFYTLGFAAERFIGFIYFNEQKQIVRIAYVDFWGRRRDIEVPLSDIIPRNECPTAFINKIWFPLRRYSTNQTLKLQLESGVVVNPKLLKKIL